MCWELFILNILLWLYNISLEMKQTSNRKFELVYYSEKGVCSALVSPSEKVWGAGLAVNFQICFSRKGIWIIIERRICEIKKNEENRIRNKWITCQRSYRWRTNDNHSQSAAYEILSQKMIKTRMKRFWALKAIWGAWSVYTTL